MEVLCNYPGSPEVGGVVWFENHTTYALPFWKFPDNAYISHTSPANLTIINSLFNHGQAVFGISSMFWLWKVYSICNPMDEVLEIMNVSNNQFISPG